MRIRECIDADYASIAAIYAHEVATGIATFELDPPSEAEMRQRGQTLIAAGYPYFVAEQDGQVLGYAYAGPFRTRPAYRATCENSVYIAPAAHRTGVGRALMQQLLATCTERGYRQMIAGVSAGETSIKFHEALGFRKIGHFESVGFKFGRWIDVVFLQRALGAGAGSPLA